MLRGLLRTLATRPWQDRHNPRGGLTRRSRDWLRMAIRIPLVGMLLLSGLVLAACGGGTNGPPAQANYTGNQGPQPGDSSILGDAGLSFGVGKGAKKQDSAGGGAL